MKGLVYAPGAPPMVVEVRNFSHIQSLCGGYVERVILASEGKGRTRRSIELWCNEDGIGLRLPVNLWAEGPLYTGAPIFGTAVVLAGVPGEDGDESAGLTDAEAVAWMLLRRPVPQPGHRSSDGCWVPGAEGPKCGCQSCRATWGAP